MARLSEQLKYFIAKKVSEDSAWAKIKIVLSGHDVPGEGEHKIMEYIRFFRASSSYSPNTRHCLYGLDADLIMLGLLSHEPHFSLLREEVTFGRKKKTGATSNPDSQNFYLMHLSIFREYLDSEFGSLKSSLQFTYNLENIIDDFVLMSFFVGNDFIPHLPGLHINEGALASFFNSYKATLPRLDGYINENGFIQSDRLEEFLKAISALEIEAFSDSRADAKFVEKLGVSFGIDAEEDESESSPEQYLFLWCDSDEDESDEESKEARNRVFKRYDKAQVMNEEELIAELEQETKKKFDAEFAQWKIDYYKLMGVLPSASKALIPPAFRELMTDPNSPLSDFYPVDFETDLNGKKQDWEAVVKIPFIDEKRLVAALRGWPFLYEAKVVSLLDELFVYSAYPDGKGVSRQPHSQIGQDRFYNSVEKIEVFYSKRFGAIVGPIEVIVVAKILRGMKLADDGSLHKDFGDDFPEVDFALQTVVEDRRYEDPRFVEKPAPSLAAEFPLLSPVFFLGNINYGATAEVKGHAPEGLTLRILVKFPEVFAGLERKPRGDLYDENDFFPREAVAERVAALKEWLKSKGVKDLDRVSLDAKALPKAYINEIERVVDEIYAGDDSALSSKPLLVKNVPRLAALKPNQVQYRLGHQTFELGERVINVADVGSVPLAARGTVVGIHSKMLEVIFDVPFIGANSLDGR
ncbi:hypothetical protein HDU96_000062 [Phlyctochytrium bullatum]|nr:hypothetical protein HDU96_000062 [Phlyctochytrium bullatum]